MAQHRTRAQSRNAGANYTETAKLFAVCGHWPLPRAERERLYAAGRYKLPAWYGHTREPANPPAGMTLEQIAKADGYLRERGWTLVRNAVGVWHAMRML